MVRMKKISHEEIQESKPSVEDVRMKKRNPIYVVLNNVRSLYNVGSFFRTSDGALVEKIFLCGITGVPPRNEISKTALGAEEVVPFEYAESAKEVILSLKKEGVEIVAVELIHGAERYDQAQYNYPICFIFGHEVNGMDSDLVELCDRAVYVPMLGRANSLNVASCYAIIVYDALRKLNGG